MASVVSNGASAPPFDRFSQQNNRLQCRNFFFLWVNFARFCSILLELLPLHLMYGL